MKQLKLIDQVFWTKKDLRTDEIIEKVAQLFALREDEFKPTVLYGGKLTHSRNKKFDSSKVSLFKKCFKEESVLRITLTNNDKEEKDVIFGFTIDFARFSTVVSFQVTHSYFSNHEKLLKFLSIAENICNIIRPMYGEIHDLEDSNELLCDNTYRVHECLPGVYWYNYFGKYYIEKIGKDKLLSSPASKIEELGNGDIIVYTSDNPFDYSSPTSRKSQKKLRKYLGIKNKRSNNIF